jgi:hypothetical protein
MAQGAGVADLPLLNSQRNEVYRLIERFGLQPGDFEWSVRPSPEGDGVTVDVLVHSSTGYSFIFDTNRRRVDLGIGGDRLSFLNPGPEHPHVRSEDFGWEGQRDSFVIWLRVVEREASTESLWDRLDQEPLRTLAVAKLNNERLTRDERRAVDAGVEQARAYLRGIVPDPERLMRIEEKLDDIKDSAGRLGRKDFFNAALGAIMAIAFEAALQSEQVNHLARLLFSQVTKLIGQ